MAKNNVEKEVIEIVAEVLEVKPKEIKSSTNLAKDLGAESLDLVDLVVAFEDHFGVEVDDQDIASIQTIADITSYIEKRQGC